MKHLHMYPLIHITPLTAPVVKEIFTMYSEGRTVKDITEMLNAKAIKTTRNNPMTIDSVIRLLKNRKYIGEYKYRDVVNPEGVPAIVSKELFDRVQERMEKNKKAPARKKAVGEEYLLTTKLYCGKCGAFMVGECGKSNDRQVYERSLFPNIFDETAQAAYTENTEAYMQLFLDAEKYHSIQRALADRLYKELHGAKK